LKGHGFAADIVQATAVSIQDDFVKEASKKLSVTRELRKMAKELSESGNQMASDMVMVTIGKIKKNAAFDDEMSNFEEMESGWESSESEDMCEKCEEDGEDVPGIGYSKQSNWLCAKHLDEALDQDSSFEEEQGSSRFSEGGWSDYGNGAPSDEDDYEYDEEK
jgi:hypothetical protein